jgi:PAS domain S-box-containing protein
MNGYQYTPWIWPMLGSAVFVGVVGLYIWRRRATPGAFPLALVAWLVSLLCLANAAEIAATDFPTQRLWFVVRNALTLPSVIGMFWFALEYAGFRRWLTRPVIGVLVGSIIVHAPLHLVDGGRLLWSRIWWDGGVRADLAFLGAVTNAYGFGLFLVVTAIFVILFVRSPAHRIPVALILLGQLTVRVAYPLGALNILHIPNLPLIVLAFDFATLMYAIALFRFRMFDLVPVARETILRSIPEAMLVLDTNNRIADLNEPAEHLFATPRPQALGRSVGDVLGSSPELLEHVMGTAPATDAVSLPGHDGTRWCQVSRTELTDWHGSPIGRLIVLHDITELRQTQERLLRRERALAVAQEREHMARELHDSVGQVLGFLSLQADSARKLLSDGKEREARGQLGRIADVAREAHADVRGYISQLQEAPSPQRPLLEVLRQELDGFTRNYGIPAELTVDPELDDVRIEPASQTQLLRVVQETLTNARRHGHARHVRVALDDGGSEMRLVIEDDGRGFDPASAVAGNDGRYGLRFMRERATELGGVLDVVSAPGEGTRVVLRLPPVTTVRAATAAGAGTGRIDAGAPSR